MCDLIRTSVHSIFFHINVQFVVQIAQNNALLRCCSGPKCRHLWHLVSEFIVFISFHCEWFFALKFVWMVFLSILYGNYSLNRPECENQVKGHTGAVFKKFKTEDEANQFIQQKRQTATLSAVGQTATSSVRFTLFSWDFPSK